MYQIETDISIYVCICVYIYVYILYLYYSGIYNKHLSILLGQPNTQSSNPCEENMQITATTPSKCNLLQVIGLNLKYL